MRGPERRGDGPRRTPAPPRLLRFATDDLPPADRVAQWRDVMGRTLTGCVPSPLEGGELGVELTIAVGEQVRLGITRLHHIRNHRDASCLADDDEDLIFFLLLDGVGDLEHRRSQVRLARGDGLLARFDRTLDTRWPDADLMLIRLPQAVLGGRQPDRLLGQLQPGTSTLMRLLRTYARTAWREAVRTGELAPIAERHLGELLGALCAASGGPLPVRGDPAVAAARLAGLREVLARRFAEPSLSMHDVASAVGLSERAGYLAFEQAGASFSEELHTLRLQHARERLRTQPGRRVVDVAFEVGFSDASHFYRLFRRRFGCTPGDVRHH